MRGLASVLTVAFVFASASLLLGQAAGQASSEPSPPEEYRQPAPDAFVEGIVSGPDGPIEGAQVSSSSYGSPGGPQPQPAEDSSDGTTTSSSIRCYDCYYGGYNSTATGADGHFFLGVWSGETQLSVYHPDFRSAYATVTIAAGETASHDIQLEAYPEKTAHLIGKITDAKTGKGLPFASLSVRSPFYGVYACSQPEGAQSGSGGGTEPAAGDEAKSMPYPYYDPGCDITIHSDGSFEGDVTPGYSILSVYAYQDCSTSRDADGGGTTTCGPEYLGWSRTLSLPANETTRVDIALPSRPSPDATVSGYLVDLETGKAVSGGTISFSNQETYAWGSATTDGDGSFKIRLRSGYHMVSVYANGYLSWEGVLQVKPGSTDFDVQITPGQESYGGCCYYAMEGKAVTADMAAPGVAGGSGMASTAATSTDDGAESSQALTYEDLGGGLGPYNAAERSQAVANDDQTEPSDKGTPAPGLLLALAALGAVLVLRRRWA